MAHRMGLAQFTLGSITIPTTITYLNNTETNRTGSNTITASNSFNGFTPFDNSGTYLYLIRSATSTSLNSNTGTDQWTSALTYNLTAGSTSAQTAYSRRHNWPATTSATWNYTCLGSASSFTVPCTGNYKIECWGADGESKGAYTGGGGGYVCGCIDFEKDMIMYVHVGFCNSAHSTTDSKRGYNGGGKSNLNPGYGGDGGGATDIRLTSGNWDNTTGFKTRIIVAGGGGAAGNRGGSYGSGNGGCGGGLIGGTGQCINHGSTNYNILTGGTQDSGGVNTFYASSTTPFRWEAGCGQFGKATTVDNNGYYQTLSGGGGGWYGGAGGIHSGGGGGSSFISGHLGCNGWDNEREQHSGVGQPSRVLVGSDYKSFSFINCKMIDGSGLLWEGNQNNGSGSATIPSKPDNNGYARITLDL